MDFRQISVLGAIAAHRTACAADDAIYGDDGKPITKDKRIVRSLDAAERRTMREFARAQCFTPEDVQAKVKYLLTGVGAGQSVIWDIIEHDRYADSDWKGTGQSPLLRDCIQTLVLATDSMFAVPHSEAREQR